LALDVCLIFFYYDHSEIVTESGIGKRRIRNRRCTFLIFGFHGSENENIQSGDACQKGKYRKGNDICDTGEGKSMGKKIKNHLFGMAAMHAGFTQL